MEKNWENHANFQKLHSMLNFDAKKSKTLLIFFFFPVKSFPDLKSWMGLNGICFMYASLGFLNTIWAICTIPDNRGISLVGVEESYEDRERQPLFRRN